MSAGAVIRGFWCAAALAATGAAWGQHGQGGESRPPQDAGRPPAARGEERRPAPPPPKDWVAPGETWFSNVRQITVAGEKSGEAYFSPDQKFISYQSVRGDCPHYQIFVEALDGTALWRVSPGVGLTTCSHWRPDGKRLMWASTHTDPSTFGPPPAEGGAYAWNKHRSFDIFDSNPDGSDRRRLTDAPGYDAEGSYSPDGSRIVFCSERDGDLEIYTMAADGGDVRRVTRTPGYDGGPFFSPDGKRICFRGFRDPKNPRYAQIFVVDADGSNEKQLTFDVAVNWAPYWHADGETLVYSKNVGGHRNYDLFLVKASGGSSVRISRAPEADVLPVFSPDGKKILWTSTRADGRSQLFIADFRMPTAEEWATLAAEEEARLAAEKVAAAERAKAAASAAPAAPAAEPIRLDAERLLADVKTLADDRLEGRRAGTETAKLAAGMVTIAFREAGLAPADDDGDYLQKFPMLVGYENGEGGVTMRQTSPENGFHCRCPASPSAFTSLRGAAGTPATGGFSFRGYGLAVDGVSDDYAGLPSVKGRVVVLFERGVPSEALAAADPHSNPQAYFDAYPKALAAKMRGAAGVVFVRDSKGREGDELAAPTVDGGGADVGIPCARIPREHLALVLDTFGRKLGDFEKAASATQGVGFDLPVEVTVDKRLVETRGDALNVIAAVRGTETPNEHVLITAHYDHLGWGGQGSLAEGGAAPQVHNGADDNASGTAGLIGLAQWFAKRPAKRTLVFVAFSGEEEGLLGSQHFLAHPPVPVDSIVAVVNLDMIGRYRPEEGVAIDGAATAEAFQELIAAANGGRLKVSTTAGAMSGRSDHASFIARGIPALHLFTGAHVDYHKPSDDADKIDAKGLAAVAELAGEIARRLADLPQRPAFVKPKPVASVGGTGFGAWLGTIPSYAQDEGGVRLSGVSAGSPAEKAGLKADDVLIRLGDFPVGNIQDFTTALRSRKPGDEVEVEVLRGGAKTVFKVVLGRR